MRRIARAAVALLLAALLVPVSAHAAPASPRRKKGGAPAAKVAKPAPSQEALAAEPPGAILSRARARFEGLEYDEVLPLVEHLLGRAELPLDVRLESLFLQGSSIAVVADPLDAEKPFRMLLRTQLQWELPPKTPGKIEAVFRKVQVEEKTIAAQLKALARAKLIEGLFLNGDFPRTGRGGFPMNFKYRLRDPTGAVTSVKVAYRRGGQPYSYLALQQDSEGTWRGSIPGEWTSSEEPYRLEYYVETADAEGTLISSGTAAAPLQAEMSSGTVDLAKPPPVPEWVFWTSAGVTMAASVASGVLGLTTSSTQTAYADYAARGQTTPIEGARLTELAESGQSYAAMTNVALVSAAVAAATTLVLLPFTDFEGEQRGETP